MSWKDQEFYCVFIFLTTQQGNWIELNKFKQRLINLLIEFNQIYLHWNKSLIELYYTTTSRIAVVKENYTTIL